MIHILFFLCKYECYSHFQLVNCLYFNSDSMSLESRKNGKIISAFLVRKETLLASIYALNKSRRKKQPIHLELVYHYSVFCHRNVMTVKKKVNNLKDTR
jgi:hypothetical protein